MSTTDYIIRKDRIPNVISGDYEINGKEILKENYPYILDSIYSEGHEMEEYIGDFFKEILFEDKVVGFVIYEILSDAVLSLTEIYVLPEFRGNKLFITELESIFRDGSILFISQPTRKLVEILIHYGLASKLSDNIVSSAISFHVPNHRILTNSNLLNMDMDKFYASNLYVLDICSTIFLEDISTPGANIIYYHYELEDDDVEFNCRNKREEILNDKYFDNIKNFLLNNQEEVIGVLFELKNRLPKPESDFDEIIGMGDDLSQHMQDIVDEGIITEKEAYEIKTQLTIEYCEGEVNDDGILTRLNYFINKGESEYDNRKFNLNLPYCPYCSNNYNLSDSFCLVCGYNLHYQNPYDDEKLSNMVLVSLIEDKNFRKLFINSVQSDFENDFEKFFEIMDKNPELKNSAINLLTSDNYNEEDFINLFEDATYIDDEINEFFNGLNGYDYESYSDDIYSVIKNLIGDRKYKLDKSIFQDSEKSYDSDIFKILTLADKGYDFRVAFIGSENPPFLKDYLINEGYVTTQINSETWSQYADKYLTVNDLKDILRKNSLKVAGRKQELIDRIAENNISFDEFYCDEYFLTQKGKDYLDEYYWIGIFNESMSCFDFDDFIIFFNKHDGDFEDIAFEYLDEHIKITDDDFEYITECYHSKALLFMHYNKLKKALEYEMKIFCASLNSVNYRLTYDEKCNTLIKDNIKALRDLSDDLGEDLVLTTFEKIWYEMDFDHYIITMQCGEYILKEVLNGENYSKYNKFLSKSFDEFLEGFDQSKLDDYL